MANDRMLLVCRHCGAEHVLAVGYGGEYYTRTNWDDPDTCVKHVKALDMFLNEHGLNCIGSPIDEIDASDNARNHYMILPEHESWDPKKRCIRGVERWDDNGYIDSEGVIKMPDEF